MHFKKGELGHGQTSFSKYIPLLLLQFEKLMPPALCSGSLPKVVIPTPDFVGNCLRQENLFPFADVVMCVITFRRPDAASTKPAIVETEM